MPICCVYILFNIEGFYYIGQTTNLNMRLSSHRYDFRNDGHGSSKKLGAEWDCEILEECPADELHIAERFYYDFYQEIDSEHCVNKVKPLRTKAEYQADHSDMCRESERKYYAKNAEKLREASRKYQRRYRAENPDKNKGTTTPL